MTNDRLRWIQPAIEPGYHELRAGDEQPIATLRFEPRPQVAWGYTDRHRATAQAGSAHWDFWIERSGLAGFLGLKAAVRITGTHDGSLTAGTNFINGTLQLTDGRQFQWSGGASRRGSSTFSDQGGRLLIRFREGSMTERVNTFLEADPEALTRPVEMMLIALGLYLRLAMTKVFRR